jgi:hypothetical protein
MDIILQKKNTRKKERQNTLTSIISAVVSKKSGNPFSSIFISKRDRKQSIGYNAAVNKVESEQLLSKCVETALFMPPHSKTWTSAPSTISGYSHRPRTSLYMPVIPEVNSQLTLNTLSSQRRT